MSRPILLPGPSLLHVEYLSATDDTVILTASAAQVLPHCRDCRLPAERVHSRYYCMVADEPTARGTSSPSASPASSSGTRTARTASPRSYGV